MKAPVRRSIGTAKELRSYDVEEPTDESAGTEYGDL